MATGKALTNPRSDEALDWLLSGTKYVALFTGEPSESGTASELSGGGYARQVITFGAPENNPGGGRRRRNANLVQFPIATTNWTVTHFGIYSTSTGGTLEIYGELKDSLGNPITVNAGERLVIEVNGLWVGID